MENKTKLADYINALLVKSEEAYLMALEIINKPTILYRTEGFCYFICNAWELLLKAFIINQSKDIDSIKYKDKPNRSLGLNECVEKVMSSTTDKVKGNINRIAAIRNQSTHNILPEYDYLLASSFQRCLTNYNNFFKKHFPAFKLNETITPFISLSKMPTDFNSPLSMNPESYKFIDSLKLGEGDGDITQNIRVYVTKKQEDADMTIALDPNADSKGTFMNVPKDINKMYPHTCKNVISLVKETIKLRLGTENGFTQATFHDICKKYKIKENESYCYTFDYSGGVKKYSDLAIEYISDLYVTNEALREQFRSKKTDK